MPRKRTQEEFITDATDAHNGRYGYSNARYINNTTKVSILCDTHGEFWQIPKDHLKGKGCNKCAIEANSLLKIDTKESFTAKAIKIHGDTYSYDRVVYKSSKANTTITCKIHGDFEQIPNTHLAGSGCPKCGKILISSNQAKTTEQFVKEATKLYKGKYDYSNTVYTRSNKKLTIRCPTHGEFTVSANRHLQGGGCQKCSSETRVVNRPNVGPGWTYSRWESTGKTSASFDSFKVYVIRCWDGNEEFIKIGKTYRTVRSRFRPCHLPYKWEVLKLVEGDARLISELESSLHKKLGSKGDRE